MTEIEKEIENFKLKILITIKDVAELKDEVLTLETQLKLKEKELYQANAELQVRVALLKKYQHGLISLVTDTNFTLDPLEEFKNITESIGIAYLWKAETIFAERKQHLLSLKSIYPFPKGKEEEK